MNRYYNYIDGLAYYYLNNNNIYYRELKIFAYIYAVILTEYKYKSQTTNCMPFGPIFEQYVINKTKTYINMCLQIYILQCRNICLAMIIC